MPVKVGLRYVEKWNSDFEAHIQKYEARKDKKGQIVFYGPSNFTRWGTRWGMTPLREAVLGKSGAQCCINRGFGSSCPEHHLYYYDRLVRPLEPKILVYSPGLGNGLSFDYTAEELWELAQRVMVYAKTDFPDLKIYLCGINTYKNNKEVYQKYDNWMREFAKDFPDCTYVDVSAYEPLHRTDIYVEDNVHFNRIGYEIYADFFREVLKDELDNY